MKFNQYIVLFLILPLIIIAEEGKKIEILNANNTYANTKKHPDYWRLVGDVAFKHNNAIMYCDSAYHYVSKNKMEAFGNIKISQGDSIKLTGNKLIYHAEKNKIDIKSNVKLTDKFMILETEQIFYNLKINVALYPNYGKIIDNERIIESKKGEYHSNKHNFIFNDSVTVIAKDYKILTNNMHYNTSSKTTYFFGPSSIISKDKKIYCENGWYNTESNISQFKKNASITTPEYILKGDSLYYNKKLRYGKAMKNVEVIDTVENIIVTGGIAEYYEEKNFFEITKNPVLKFQLEKDTLFINADKFISQQEKNEKKMLAFKNVKIVKTDLLGKCDSLSYNLSDSTLEMFYKPVIWVDEFQITSDSIKFLLYQNKIKTMVLKPNPIIISEVDSLDYNQIQGRHMTGYFNKNKINKIDVDGNGQSIFTIIDEKNYKKIGVNFTNCSDLTLYFKENKLDAINYKTKPNSITTPYRDVEEKDRYLKEFNWRKAEKPEK